MLEVDSSPFFSCKVNHLFNFFFFPSRFQKIYMRCVESSRATRGLQVVVLMTNPLTFTFHPALPFKQPGDAFTRAPVKEERMPRSIGPLDSDLLISQPLGCLPVSLSICPRLHPVFSLLWFVITACRGKYSQGLSRPGAEVSARQHTGHYIQQQTAVGRTAVCTA